MKKTLAENLLRFAPKNLDAKTIKKLQQIAEQTQKTGGTITTTSTTPTTTPTVNVPEISGFTWAEDDQAWKQTLEQTPSIDDISNRNTVNMSQYYGSDPIGKQILVFNPAGFGKTGGYVKNNLLSNYIFTVKKIEKTSPSANTISIKLMSSDSPKTPFIWFVWNTSNKTILRYYPNNTSNPVDVKNSVLDEICRNTAFQKKYEIS